MIPPWMKKFNSVPSAGKILDTFFNVILVNFFPRETTLKAVLNYKYAYNTCLH
jgi:hypothetical protein